jgi:hypothetical protein
MPSPCRPIVLKGTKEDQTSQYLFRLTEKDSGFLDSPSPLGSFPQDRPISKTEVEITFLSQTNSLMKVFVTFFNP